MAASPGQYRVSINYDNTQCDLNWNHGYQNEVSNAYFDASAYPTSILTITPKTGYRVVKIEATCDFVSKEELKANQLQFTFTGDPSFDSGNANVTVTTEAISFNLTVQGGLNVTGSIKQNGTDVSLNGHTHTPASIGAATASHTHTPSSIGAAAASHTHSNYVPTTRKVNNKTLSADISLTAADVNARPSTWTPTAADVGALPSGGTAAAATKLATARTILTDLGKKSTASFNGTANATPGVTGTLGIANGGTGAANTDTALDNLKAVGRQLSGKSVKPTSSTTVTAGTGAEVFNNYGNLSYDPSGNLLNGNVATGDYSHAEGDGATASGNYSHAEGYHTKAIGRSSHAEGDYTTANGHSSHAEGSSTTADGVYSHAEGMRTEASGTYSHAEGFGTTASGSNSHAEGSDTTAESSNSHAEGYGTKANAPNQHVGGLYNVTHSSNTSKFIIGKGTSDTARANCFRVTDTGTYASGNYNASGADYAELFEWADGNPDAEDRAGLFVTLDGDKLRLAAPEDDYILGIVSGNPSIVGDVHDDQWAGMYLYDVFGRPLWEDVEGLPDETVEEPDPENPEQTVTRVIIPAHTEHRQKLNPDYDGTKPYKARTQRPEWDAVGLMGKLVAVDDGTCKPNGYCTVGNGGMATASETRTRFRVMRRLDETHVQVMVLN